MAADLHGVIRIAKSTVDDRRRALANVLRKAEDLAEQRLALEREVLNEGRLACDASQSALYLGAYAASAMDRERRLDQELAAVEREIDGARGELGDAFRELRALELTEEARQRRRAEAAVRKERAALDEIGLQRHVRANASGAASAHDS